MSERTSEKQGARSEVGRLPLSQEEGHPGRDLVLAGLRAGHPVMASAVMRQASGDQEPGYSAMTSMHATGWPAGTPASTGARSAGRTWDGKRCLRSDGASAHVIEGLSYVRQGPGEIAYWLFEGKAPREAVRVLVERVVAVPGGEVVLAIIGSSHFLQITAGGSTVTEMLASMRPELESVPIAPDLRNGRGERRLTREGLDYRFRLEEIHYGAGSFDRESARLTRDADDRLFYVFPADEDGTSAVTCLDWRVDGRVLTLDTYHTFPCESTIVRSRTVVWFAERGGTP